jgi:hypothetical protein
VEAEAEEAESEKEEDAFASIIVIGTGDESRPSPIIERNAARTNTITLPHLVTSKDQNKVSIFLARGIKPKPQYYFYSTTKNDGSESS